MPDWNDFFQVFSSQFHFLRPEWFLGLLPVFIFILWLRFERKNSGEWQRLIPAHLLKHLVAEQHSSSTKSALALLSLIWILSIIALAGPAWQKIPQPVYEKLHARVYILDLSYSMYAADLKPSRISRARLKLIDLLQNQKEGLNGLVVYAGDAHIVTPLSSDVNTIISLVTSLEPSIMPNMGSDTLSAINKAIDLFDNIQGDQAVGGQILLLTDEVSAEQISNIKTRLQQTPYPLSILGAGTTQGAPISLPDGQFFKDDQGNVILPKMNAVQLKDLAETTGGRYIDIQKDNSDVQYLQPENSFTDNAQVRESNQNFDVWLEAGYWLLLPIVFLSAFAFRRGWILGLLVLLSLGTQHSDVQASETSTQPETWTQKWTGTWNNLWLTPDQQGFNAFKRGDFEQAAKSFNSTAWRASAFYRNNQFHDATEDFTKDLELKQKSREFSKNELADAWYNLGNAQAKSGALDKAIKSYEQSLTWQAEHEDAIFNKALVEKVKEQQQNQDSEQEQQGENEDNEKDGDNGENKESGENSESSEQSGKDDDTQQDSSEQNKPENESERPSQQEKQASSQNDSAENSSDKKQQQKTNQNQKQDAENKQSSQEENKGQAIQSDTDENAHASTDKSEAMTALEKEEQQALEQWLRQVPDDPSGLLRRKFQLETERNRQNRRQTNNHSQQSW